MDVDKLLRIIEFWVYISTAVFFLQKLQRSQEEEIELLWKILDQLSTMSGDKGVMSGFRARSGRFIRPKHD